MLSVVGFALALAGSLVASPPAALMDSASRAASTAAAPLANEAHSGPAPLTLDGALAEAARQNLDLAFAKTDRARSSAEVLGSYRGYLPRLDVSATFGRNVVGSQRVVRAIPVVDMTTYSITGYEEQPVWTPRSDYADYTLGLRLEERLFEGWRSWSQVRSAAAAEHAAALHFDETALSVAFGVTRRFYDLVRAEQSLAVLEETVRQSAELVTRAEALFAAGRLKAGETYAARVNLGNDRINVEVERARVAQARAELSLVLGRSAEQPLVVVPPAALDGAPPASYLAPPAQDALLARAHDARPARARELERARVAELGVTMARADYFPALGVSVGYTRESPDLAGGTGVYGSLARQYVLGGQLYVKWNLFDGLATTSASEVALAEAERARLTTTQTEQTIAAEVVRARESLIAQAQAAIYAGENLASAETSVRLARERFDAGAATQLEVRDAQLKLTQARLALVSTRSDCAVAFAELNRAVGGGL